MGYLKTEIEGLVKKYQERAKRALIMLDVITKADEIDEHIADRLIESEIEEIKRWPVHRILNEFVDSEELLIRALSKKI